MDAFSVYEPHAEGKERALVEGRRDPVLRQTSPISPATDFAPFSEDTSVLAKRDIWRENKVPEIILNADGIPVLILKDGKQLREYGPAEWLPSLRVRVWALASISACLGKAEYSIHYFVFSKKVLQYYETELTDAVRGLKTPILPWWKPAQPYMRSSTKLHPNYQISFDVRTVKALLCREQIKPIRQQSLSRLSFGVLLVLLSTL